LSQLKRETPHGADPFEVVNALTDAAESLEMQNVSKAAVMVPGTVNKERTTVVQAPNLNSLDNFDLKRSLEDRLKVPVLLENDANAAAVGEMWMGAARGARNVICITLGTGVGGGIILDGQLWRGTDGSAGEIGHTTLDPFNGPKCRCGNNGCIEMYASATAIVRMTSERLLEFPKSTLHGKEITAKLVFMEGVAGDALAISVFKTVGDYLGAGLANLINLLGPEIIVIGGGVANGWDLFEPYMREQIQHRSFPSLARNVMIKKAECGDNAGLLGAAYLAR
jgi:glucokinase